MAARGKGATIYPADASKLFDVNGMMAQMAELRRSISGTHDAIGNDRLVVLITGGRRFESSPAMPVPARIIRFVAGIVVYAPFVVFLHHASIGKNQHGRHFLNDRFNWGGVRSREVLPGFKDALRTSASRLSESITPDRHRLQRTRNCPACLPPRN